MESHRRRRRSVIGAGQGGGAEAVGGSTQLI